MPSQIEVSKPRTLPNCAAAAGSEGASPAIIPRTILTESPKALASSSGEIPSASMRSSRTHPGGMA